MKYLLLLVIILFLTLNFSCTSEEPVEFEESLENYFKDKDVEVIFENDPTNGINIIFMGDAYLKQDLDKTNSKYRYDGIKSIEFLFGAEPFKTYKKYFNAYIVYAKSTIEPKGNTFEVYYPFGSTNVDLLTISNNKAVSEYVKEVTGNPITEKDLILMGVNYGDGGSAFLGGNVAVYSTFGSKSPTNNVFPTAIHEVGHAFSSLGDEYVNPYRPNFPCNTTISDNLDTTNNLSIIKWSHFTNREGYSEVQAYEGGCVSSPTGVWRPEAGSIMSGNIGYYFNAPSRESIVKRILELIGLEYSFENFLELDNSDLPTGLRTPGSSNLQINCHGTVKSTIP